MKSHYCPSNPDSPGWVEGAVSGCPFHARPGVNRGAKWGTKSRRRSDREAGVVGVERKEHGFISGT